MPTRKFNAEDYRDTTRSQLIELIRQGKLSKKQVDQIANLDSDGTKEKTFYQNRVRRVIRYCIARKKTFALGGAPISEAMDTFLSFYRATQWYQIIGGFSQYGITWDIGEKAPFNIVPLEESHDDAWNKIITEQAIPLEELFKEEEPDSNIKRILNKNAKIIKKKSDSDGSRKL